MFKTIEWPPAVKYCLKFVFLTLGMCYQVRFITRSVKCMVCDGMVRKWVRMFSEGRKNVHDEARSGRPSLVNDDFVCKANERVRDDRLFTISDLSLHFPQISRTLLYDTVSSG